MSPKVIDSQALGLVTRALGLSGEGAQITELHDSTVDQVLGIAPIVRRSGTLGDTEGIFTAILQNNHAVADSQSSSANPYDLAATLAIAPYPDPVPAGFEVWLLYSVLRRNSGSGTLSALLGFQATVAGWGVDEAGAAVADNLTQPLAYWDAIGTEGGVAFGILTGTRGVVARHGFRLPRRGTPDLSFRTTSSAAAVFSCQLTLGLFPICFGQDAMQT